MEKVGLEVKDIPLSSVNISELNTRKDLDAGTEDTGLEDLASSIREKGLLNPITVMKTQDGRYDLIAGQRRFLACKRIGMQSIPAIIREKMDDTDATIISLVENVHRADMAPIDKARAYSSIYEKYKDYDRVAKETGVHVTTIKRYLSLLNLSPTIQEKLTTSEGVAGVQTLSRLADTYSPEEQEKVLEGIGGFKQNIQLEIIKRSQGDVNKIPELRAQAMEGLFDVRTCREGLCISMPELLKTEVKRFVDGELDAEAFKDNVRRLRF